jgi:hypothetical protein
MAFTNTTLSITPLLETTFISDMRIIVNSNVTVLKSKLEDVINTLQIDLVNKYIGTDLPISLLRSEGVTVTNQLLFKSGNSSGAATIASLTQSAGTSTFSSHNIEFTNALSANANSSRAALKTVIVGGTSGGTALSFPTSAGAGIPDPGLYVGDTATPVPANFYGNAGFTKTAITQSTNYSAVRVIQATRPAGTYSHVPLVLARTDPQYLAITVKLGDSGTQAANMPIWIQLHESFESTSTRPQVGQSFTIVFNDIIDSGSTPVVTSAWPAVQSITSLTGGINIMPGWDNDSSPGTGNVKPCLINNFGWTSGNPSDASTAVTRLAGNTNITDRTWVRLYSPGLQVDDVANKLGACVTFTKIAEESTLSRYIVTGGSNYIIVNNS